MDFKINKFIYLIFLILLQSCSGGRIGNFLESSFKNIEEPKIKEDIKNNLKNKQVKISKGNADNKNIEEPKIKEDIKSNLKNKQVKTSKGNADNKNIAESKIQEDIKNNLKNKQVKISKGNADNKNIAESKIQEDIKNNLNNKKLTNLDNKTKQNKKNISFRKMQYKPQSYKIIFILKDVDPKDPTEDLRRILINSQVNFEIEKIERFADPKNKGLKRN